MRYSDPVEVRALRYAQARNVRLADSLGSGIDGAVLLATDDFGNVRAVKVFERNDLFLNELKVYRRLAQRAIEKVAGHAVPVMLDHDEALGVLELTVVSPPYVLDFASATLDAPPDFPPHVLRDNERKWLARFGAERWSRVQVVLAGLRGIGIHHLDPNPRNIRFSPGEEAAWEAALERGGDWDDSPSPASFRGDGAEED